MYKNVFLHSQGTGSIYNSSALFSLIEGMRHVSAYTAI